MINGKLYCQDNHQLLLSRVMRTTNPFEKMRGLLGRPPLGSDQALLIIPCSSIHTIGMRYPIDLIFLDKNWQIRKIVNKLKPFRMVCAYGAHVVIEMLGGTLDNLDLTAGTILKWEENLCA